MIDLARTAVYVKDKDTGQFTPERPAWVADEGAFITVQFAPGGKPYRYGRDRVLLLAPDRERPLGRDTIVFVRGKRVPDAGYARRYPGPDEPLWRIEVAGARGERETRDCRESEVEFVRDAAQSAAGRPLMAYLRDVVGHLTPGRDNRGEPLPLQRCYAQFDLVHEDSVLGQILSGQPIASRPWSESAVFPFECNLSQREALDHAVRHSLSVIDGPPGTGKTQTILNLVATVVTRRPDASIGVVSFNNAAVANVAEKLSAQGFGFLVAVLGNRDNTERFFARQAERNAELLAHRDHARLVQHDPGRHAALDADLARVLRLTLRGAQLRQQLAAFELEREHVRLALANRDLPARPTSRLFGRRSTTLIDFLVQARLAQEDGAVRHVLRQLSGRLRFGGVWREPSRSAVVPHVQAAFYDRRVGELRGQLAGVNDELERLDAEGLASEHRESSLSALNASLAQRYGSWQATTFADPGYRASRESFRRFIDDYPVLLSTCHSLRRSLPDGQLLDYLVIDEASQLDVATGALALASARNVIVVGDLAQLPHIADQSAAQAAGPPPTPAFDYAANSVLAAVIAHYGEQLPRTMLREHYRCDPRIIEYCNQKFYGGRLIPFTEPRDEHPIVVYRTGPGHHERHGRTGRFNRRETEVIAGEVLPPLHDRVSPDRIGVTTPYRRQVAELERLFAELDSLQGVQSDTVHKYQGREKDVMIMTTVLSQTQDGQRGLRFADDPQLVNVAVSRAVHQFILVTNFELLPASRNIRDLIDYAHLQDPSQPVVDSQIVSIFDLLYREYSDRLRPLARRLRGELAFRSEDIVWTVLLDLLQEPAYRDLTAVQHVRLIDVVRDPREFDATQRAFLQRDSELDFVVYRRAGHRPAFAIEVDGFSTHEDNPEQLRRDAIKDSICERLGLRLLRLPTTGSGEETRIRAALDDAAGTRT